MKLQTYLFLIVVVCFLGFSNCGKNNEDDPGNCNYNWAVGVQDELNGISNAFIAYGNDPTTETCNALKAAYQAYIDALKPYGDCALLTGTERQEFEDALEEAEDELPNLCDEQVIIKEINVRGLADMSGFFYAIDLRMTIDLSMKKISNILNVFINTYQEMQFFEGVFRKQHL